MGKKEEKTGIKKKDNYLLLPVDTLLEKVEHHSDLPNSLKDVLEKYITWQEKQEITVLKSLINPKIDVRWLATLLVLSAEIIYDKEKNVNLSDFLHNRSSFKDILAVLIPLVNPHTIISESKISLTPADKPIVSVVCAITTSENKIKNANIALTGVWQNDKVKLAKAASILKNKRPDIDIVPIVSNEIEKEVSPQSDFHGSEEYRRSMAVVVTRRALEMCINGVNQK